jgi:hypothetical protein
MKMKFLQCALLVTFLIGDVAMADKMIIDDMTNQSGQPDEEFWAVFLRDR